jgi:hypothetical protein
VAACHTPGVLDPDRLAAVLALHEMGYALLRWIGDGVATGTMSFTHAHEWIETPGAARAWVEGSYDDLPSTVRPAREHLAAFANLLSTYLDSSFELIENRPHRLVDDGGGTPTAKESGLVDASSLAPRRLRRHDKERARALCADVVRDLAVEQGLRIEPAAMAAFLDDEALREPLAMVAWARELMRRSEGHVSGPAVLALWRGFAWTPEGSPKRNFRLEAADLLAAEATVVAALAT